MASLDEVSSSTVDELTPKRVMHRVPLGHIIKTATLGWLNPLRSKLCHGGSAFHPLGVT
jgi:hypothetical protein